MTTATAHTSTRQTTVRHALYAIEQRLRHFKLALQPREVGTIARVSTGIARVQGLPHLGFEERVLLPGGLSGIAFNLAGR